MGRLLVAFVVIILKINPSISKYFNADLRPKHSNHYVVISESNRDFNDLRKAINDLTDDIPNVFMLRENPASNVKKNKTDAGKISRAYERKKKLVQKQHQERLDYISKFLSDHHLSAKYIKQEVSRIRKTGVIKDELRKMARILDKPKFASVRARVIACYTHILPKIKPAPIDIWKNKHTNNLVIHIVQDYINDGL